MKLLKLNDGIHFDVQTKDMSFLTLGHICKTAWPLIGSERSKHSEVSCLWSLETKRIYVVCDCHKILSLDKPSISLFYHLILLSLTLSSSCLGGLHVALMSPRAWLHHIDQKTL